MSAPSSPDQVKHLHLTVINSDPYPTSLDRQQRTIEFLQAAVEAGGLAVLRDTYVQEVVARMAMRLGVHPERIEAITRLDSHQEVRRALKASTNAPNPRARLPKERIYPTDGWLGAYVEHCLLSEQPLGWHFWCGVAALGAACRRNLYMDLGFGDVLFPNHYVLLVGESGLGKNQAINRAASILKRANKDPRVLRACLEAGKDLQVAILNEVTAESLAQSMMLGDVEIPGTGTMVTREQSVGVLINPEAANLLGKARKETSERLISFLTDFYDGDPKDATTITRGARNLGPGALTLMIGSTAEWIGTSVTQAVVSGGFTGRCTFVSRDSRDRVKYRDIPHDYVPDPVVTNELGRLLVPWMTASPIEVVMEPNAQGWWEEWYVEHRTTPTPHSSLEGWWNRKPVHLAKLSMILVASEMCGEGLNLEGVRSIPLGVRTLQHAHRLLLVEQERIPKVLEFIDRAPEVPLQHYIVEKMTELVKTKDPLNHTDIFFATRWRIGTPAKLRALLSALVDSGQVIKIPGRIGRGGTIGESYTIDTEKKGRRDEPTDMP